jgi:large subunit ribosomal protein L10
MPNAKVLSEKQAVVAALVERLQNASAGVFVDYKGITVSEDTALRSELRQNEVDYSVVKNTLVRFALDKCGLEGLDGILNGTTSLATSTSDPIVPIRLIHEASEKMKDKFTIKGAFLEGKILSEAEIAEIAALQNKDALLGKVLGTMLAPITSLAVALGQVVEQKGGSLESAEPAAEEAAE